MVGEQHLPAAHRKRAARFGRRVALDLAADEGDETAADARTHFGIFAPQTWTLLPRGHVINLYFWDYNDVAPGYFAAAEIGGVGGPITLGILYDATGDFSLGLFLLTGISVALMFLLVILRYEFVSLGWESQKQLSN